MKKAAYAPKQIKNLRALKDHVLVTDMQFGGRQLSSGIVLLSDDGKSDVLDRVGVKCLPLVPNNKMFEWDNGY